MNGEPETLRSSGHSGERSDTGHEPRWSLVIFGLCAFGLAHFISSRYDPPRDRSFVKVMSVGVVLLGLARPLLGYCRLGRRIPDWTKWIAATVIGGALLPVIEFGYCLYDPLR